MLITPDENQKLRIGIGVNRLNAEGNLLNAWAGRLSANLKAVYANAMSDQKRSIFTADNGRCRIRRVRIKKIPASGQRDGFAHTRPTGMIASFDERSIDHYGNAVQFTTGAYDDEVGPPGNVVC